MINKSGRTKHQKGGDGSGGDDVDDDGSTLSRSATGDGGSRPPSTAA